MSNFFVKLIKNPFVINLLLVIVVSCGVVYGVLAWLDSYTRHNQAVVVPDVKGMKLEDAAEFFGNNKLRYNVIDSVFSKDVAPGSIVELVPGVGSKVKEGRIVFVTINALTSQMAVIPEVEDLSFRQAYALLRARGFSSVEIEYVPGDYKDLAMGVELNGRTLLKGEHVPLTAHLVLKVSSGDPNMLPDSLALDSIPVEPLDSDIENWFKGMDEFLDDMDDEQVDDLLMPEEDETSSSQMYEHFRFVADKGQSLLRVDKFLVDRMMGATRNRIQLAAEAGCILVNDKPVKSNYRVKPLDVVSIVMDRPRRELEIIPEDIPLNIVYEDDDLLVVNKPAGLVVHPGHGNYTGTLVNALAYYLKDDPYYDPSDPRLGLVHRIDKDTSGLLVVAKRPEAKSNLSLQFFNKTTKRKYRALVWGIVQEDEGRIEGNIGRDPRDRMQMTVFPEGDQGKTAVTHYTVLERLGYVSLVECRLETGRTHQIRVHMKYIGHTLFNDERYGGHDILKGTTFTKYKQFVQNCFAICPRQALHAKTLGFVHPTTGEEMFFDSEIPSDMQQLIDRWRVYANTKEL